MSGPKVFAPVTAVKRKRLREVHKGKAKKRRVYSEFKLLPKEIDCLRDGKMLQDRHIDAACTLLRKQFPDVRGLQTPLLGQNLSFNPTEPPFVQIFHVGHIHWNTIVATDDHSVKVYDSLYHQNLGPCTTMQAASILQSPHQQVKFSVENTQMQDGGADCGLFAIAYATEFCYGNCPECYRYTCIVMYITISCYVYIL